MPKSLLTSRWVSSGIITLGAIQGTYGFSVSLRYMLYNQVTPLFFGQNPMPFSTSVTVQFNGIALLWIGLWMREQEAGKRRKPSQEISAQMTQILLAIISAMSLVLVALIGILKR